jgi:hemolysin activation/secretion protein
MTIKKKLAFLPLTALASFAYAQQAPTPADTAAAARASAEQNQQMQEQHDTQQRAAAVNAPSVRSTVAGVSEWPELPVETPCFRIGSFALGVPATLPEAAPAARTAASR